MKRSTRRRILSEKERTTSVSADPHVGGDFVGYEIEEIIGRGGMGVVYRAHEKALDRTVALKLIAPELAASSESRERFMGESRLAASLEHPGVVPIYAAGESDGQLYIAMRCIEGSDLKRELVPGPLQPGPAIAICTQVAAALDAAHEQGLVHRDVKPSNVLLDGKGRAYLADFGLTRLMSEEARPQALGTSLGTVDYVAPEQIRGEPVDGRADVYSLGCVLHECLTGHPPFRHGSDVAMLFAHLEEAPPAPPGLEHVMATALAKDPADRYPTCTELVEEAAAALGVSTRRRSRWPLAAGAVAALTAICAAIALLVTSGGPAAAASGGRLVEISPATNTVTHSITIGGKPSGVAVGAGRIWATSITDGDVWIIRPGTFAVHPVSIQNPTGVATAGRFGYVMGDDNPGVAIINPASTEVMSKAVGASGDPQEVAAGADGVWGITGDTAFRIRYLGHFASQAAPVVPIPAHENEEQARSGLDGLAVGEGAVWVAGGVSDRHLWRIDPRRGTITAVVPLRFSPGGIAAGAGGVWITDQLGNRLVEMDPATGRVRHFITVGDDPVAVAVGAGAVWVVNAAAGTVSRVDPRSHRVTETIRVGGTPTAIAVGAGNVWVAGNAQ